MEELDALFNELFKKIPHYILDGKEVREAKSMGEYMQFLEASERRVGYDTLSNGTTISTVFLPVAIVPFRGTPLFFETMVFDVKGDHIKQRYDNWDDAEKGHKQIVQYLKNELGETN